jgi:hypothetical protein
MWKTYYVQEYQNAMFWWYIFALTVIVAGTVEKLCWWCSSTFRGGFCVKLLKLKLQAPHLHGPLSRPWESLEIPWNLTARIWKKLDRGYLKFDNISKNLHDITSKELWNRKEHFKLSIVKKNKFWSTMPEEKLNYFSLSIKNITKSLSHKEAIQEYTAKKCRKKYYGGVLGSY